MKQYRRPERGFALLLIFAIAAAVAIMLYRELPRAVFESARTKEDLLVERGEQYKLAIRRFYTKNRKYPQSMDELEQMNGVRFLRRRYKDPLTGEDEWRLIHIGPAGFTDSKVFPATPQGEQKEVRQSSIGEGYQVGGGNVLPGEEEKGIQDVAKRQRATDQLPNNLIAGEDGDPAEADPSKPPPPPGENAPSETSPGSQTGQNPNQDPNNQFRNSPGNPNQPGGPNGNQPGGPGQQNNPALGMIQNLLTRPRQPSPTGVGGPTGGTGNMQAGGATQQSVFVGGIAGVASKYKGEGIKLIHERSKIDEWEFLFDYRQQQALPGGANSNLQKGGPNGRPGQGNQPGSMNGPGGGQGNFGGQGSGAFGGAGGNRRTQ